MTRLLLFFVLVSLCSASWSSTKIYKIIKPDGTVLYTDKPEPGAVLVEISGPQNVAPALQSKPSRSLRKTIKQTKKTPQIKLSITSPTQEQTLRSNSGNVQVSGQTSYKAPGNYRVYLNGNTAAEGQQPQFTLTGVPRGTHSIQIILFDNKGKQLASSQKVTFYLHKASVNNR